MMTPFISIATQAVSTAYEMKEIDKLNSTINGFTGDPMTMIAFFAAGPAFLLIPVVLQLMRKSREKEKSSKNSKNSESLSE